MTSPPDQVAGPGRPRRQRNPRGRGGQLREDVIDAATAILERTGSEYALTLRGIAREVGVTAPSVTRHFADMFEIVDAVTARETAVLYESLLRADRGSDPAERLMAICRAYVRYGRERPARYKMLLGRRWMDTWEERDFVSPETNDLMRAALGVAARAIEECVEAGMSTSTDPAYDTLILWFALDGLVTVKQAIASIEWPEEERLLGDCVARAAKLQRRPQ